MDIFDISSIWLIVFVVIVIIIIITYNMRKTKLTETKFESKTTLDENVILDPKIKLLFDKIGQPYNDFVLADEDISYFVNKQYNYDAIKFLINKIMLHLKMPYIDFNIKIFVDDKEDKRNPGNYSTAFGKPEITIRLKETYLYEQIISVVCHECMHHYLFSKNIKIVPEAENEILTDVACIYCGFYSYMRNGYQERVIETESFNKILKETIKIGYIDNFQIDYIHSVVNELRSGIDFENVHKSEEERKKEKERKKFKKILEEESGILYDVISRNHETVSIIIDNKNATLTQEDFKMLQENIINIENGAYKDRYIKLQSAIEKDRYITEEEYEMLKKDIYDLSTELTLMTSILGKYI